MPIEARILTIRGQRVIIDADLAELYGTTTKRLNEPVRRNRERFPQDFMFALTADEKAEVVANCDHLINLKFSRTLPFAFTEHGAIMAATILNKSQAIETSLFIVRAFVQLRETMSTHKELVEKFKELETRLNTHDDEIQVIIRALQKLMTPPDAPKRKIGFRGEDDNNQ